MKVETFAPSTKNLTVPHKASTVENSTIVPEKSS